MPDPTPPAPSAATHCARCGADNRCALAAGAAIEHCWCSRLPATLPLPAGPAAACYCAGCLQEIIDAR